uniref:Caspase family p20 domain-containing protein n=1 Tax=Dendroctonus ponderosae TaxID=77166 RepID=A0AAR5QCE3_DENPD
MSTIPIPSLPVGDIEIKPPIDLIPDEYPRDGNGNFYVEAFFSNNDQSAVGLLNCLEELKFSVIRTASDTQLFEPQWITRVQKSVNDKEYDGILLLFAKIDLQVVEMKEIWGQFTSKHCPKLKNKPKVFIFQLESRKGRSLQSDSTARELKWLAGYETPSEADMLIIYHKYDDGKADLLRQLSANVKDYGEQENIITLISLGFQCNYQPLRISTMTRNFYFKLHLYRGSHLNIRKSQAWTKSEIEKMKSQLAKKSEERKGEAQQKGLWDIVREGLWRKRSVPTTPGEQASSSRHN